MSQTSELITPSATAELIRVFEQLVGDGIELGTPFTYTRLSDEKQRWGLISTISAAIGLGSALAAFGLAAVGRGRSTA